MNTEKKKNIFEVVAVNLLLTCTFCVFGPLQLYITNITEFSFSMKDVWWPCVLCALVVFATLTLSGSFLKGKLHDIFVCLVFGLALGLYIQGNFVTTDYGVLNGAAIDWRAYGSVAVWDTALWVGCLALPFILRVVLKSAWPIICSGVPIGIVAVQIITLAVLCLTTDFNKGSGFFSKDGLYTVSEGTNVVCFVLDTFDQDYFEEALETAPEYADKLEGFTYFNNSTGCYPTTKGALPLILTGKFNENEKPYSEYIVEAYQETDFYADLKNAGYDVGVYVQSDFAPGIAEGKNINNYVSEELTVTSYSGLLKAMMKFTAFRYAPHLVKESLWFYSGEFDSLAASKGGVSVYTIENIPFYEGLITEGLSLNESARTYRFIHLFGPHLPFTTDENMNIVEKYSVDAVTASKGVLKMVCEYIDQLKTMGVYDNTEIIITADHGEPYAADLTNPIFLVKPFDSTGKMQRNDVPVSSYDVQATVMEDIGLNPNNKYGESALHIASDSQRSRRYLRYTWGDGWWDMEYLPDMVEYTILPEGNDYLDYVRTGRTYTNDGLIEETPYEYKLGQKILFTEENNGTEYFTGGISKAEGDVAWTSGTEGYFLTNLTEEPDCDLVMNVTISMILGDEQRLKVQSCVGTPTKLFDEYVSPGEISIFIPKECVDGKTLKLYLEYPDALTPISLGMNEDLRMLAIRIKEITVDKAPHGMTATGFDPYKLGKDNAIVFTSTDDGCRYFNYGISHVEENVFAWSLGTEGLMELHFSEQPQTDLKLHIQIRRVYNERQRLVISAKGEKLYDETVTFPEDEIVLNVPASCVEDGKLMLELAYPDAISPKELGESDDSRSLAFQFTKFYFTEAN